MLTQRVKPEPLSLTRKRMERKWQIAQRRLKKLGPIGFLCVVHCTWSRHGGFHYHLHVIMEFAEKVDLSEVGEGWADLEEGQQPAWVKHVSDARTAEVCGKPEDLIHGVDAVGSGIGYVVGEIVKGIGRFGTDGCPRGRLAEVVSMVAGLKRQRLYGDWRGAVGKYEKGAKLERKAEAEKRVVEGKGKATTEIDWEYDTMTVDEAYWESRNGVGSIREMVRGLMQRYAGKSYLCDLVRAFCMEALVVR